jgi:hypothetical protein
VIFAAGSPSHAASDSFFAFSRKYLRRRRVLRQAPWSGCDTARFSSSTYCMTRMAVM